MLLCSFSLVSYRISLRYAIIYLTESILSMSYLMRQVAMSVNVLGENKFSCFNVHLIARYYSPSLDVWFRFINKFWK